MSGDVLGFPSKAPAFDLHDITSEAMDGAMRVLLDAGFSIGQLNGDPSVTLMFDAMQSFICKIIGEVHPLHNHEMSLCSFVEERLEEPIPAINDN